MRFFSSRSSASASETRLPEDFDADAYLRLNPDVATSIRRGETRSAAEHYLWHGRHEGRRYALTGPGADLDETLRTALPADFDRAAYLDLNGDVSEAIDAGFCPSAEVHYLNIGRHEGRLYNLSPQVVEAMAADAGKELFRYPYHALGTLPDYVFEPPRRAAEDIAICERLIAAWHVSAAEDRGSTGGMWDQLTSGHTRLRDALSRRDPEALAALLSNMFQEHLVHGLAMGKSTAVRARHVPDRHAAVWGDRLLRLGEALGVRPVRSPEQGGRDAPLEWRDSDVRASVSAIEAVLGFPLVFPPIGAPYGVALRGSAFPEQSFTHAYAAWRINAAGPFARIAEIGGGYGGLCAYLATAGRAYTIYDLPYTNLLQGYFLLMRGLPVSLNGEAPAGIRVLPWWMIDAADAAFDLVVNQDSIPEMSPETGRAYLDRIKRIAPVFYSVNQEAAATNQWTHRQLRVPELAEATGGYRRLSRNLFWLRDGYVEEFYACEAS